MITAILGRSRLVVAALATSGLLLGLIVAHFLTTGEQRYLAQATLAMVPAQDVKPDVAIQFWEVLNRGQATRTAALALEDDRWRASAASATGVPEDGINLRASAITDTTLISVEVEAPTSWTAATALDTVLREGSTYAATISGPFRLETITATGSSAESLTSNRFQTMGVLGVAGLLIGAGGGVLISRSVQGRSAPGAETLLGDATGQPTPVASAESLERQYDHQLRVEIPTR
ncbi:MAG: hypothetical protein WBB00_04565 [Mycobacterium sp.]